MSINLVVENLFTACNSLNKLQSFVKDDMAGLLYELGRSEYQAAISALNDSKESNNRQREIESAITCLRLSFEKFYKNASERSLMSAYTSAFTFGIVTPFYVRSAEGAVECCLLIATCYKTLDEPRLTNNFIEKTKKAFDSFELARCDAAMYSTRMTGNFLYGEYRRRDELETLSSLRKDVYRLCDNIVSTI